MFARVKLRVRRAWAVLCFFSRGLKQQALHRRSNQLLAGLAPRLAEVNPRQASDRSHRPVVLFAEVAGLARRHRREAASERCDDRALHVALLSRYHRR